MNSELIHNLRRFWPVVVLLVLGLIFSLMLFFSRKAPVIHDMTPSMAAPGQTVVIAGEYFGRTAREGILTISGRIPPPSLIKSWSDRKIEFVVPSDVISGLVTVSNSQGTSEAVLFTDTEQIPLVLQGAARPGKPFLVGFEPAKVSTGQIITLWGESFGENPAGNLVRISTGTGWTLSITKLSGWTDHTASFLLPAGFGEGASVQLVTSEGESQVLPLESTSPVILERPLSYVLAFQADAAVQSGSGNLTLWAPLPNANLNVSWSVNQASPRPEATGTSDSAAFHWDSVTTGTKSFDLEIRVTVPQKRWKGNESGPVTGSDDLPVGFPTPLIDQTQPTVKALVAKAGGDSSDLLGRARRLFSVLVQNYAAEPLRSTSFPGASINPHWGEGKSLDPYEMSMVFIALCKNVGLSARPVSGFLAQEGSDPKSWQLQRHFWAEVFVPKAGWLSVDPSLAAGLPPPKGVKLEKPSDYYFANLDNRHIPWSCDWSAVRRREPQSKVITGNHPFAFQTALAEVSGNLEISSPVWHDGAILSVTEGAP